jgi:predicted DNA-binding protein with PD1-like motif
MPLNRRSMGHGLKTISVSPAANTYTTGGTLGGNDILTGSRNTGGTWTADLSALAGGGGTPGGSTGYIQYNTAGAFDASSNFIWTQAAETLNVNGGTPEIAVIGSDSTGGLIRISNTNADTECGEFTFLKNATAQDDMKLGRIDFDGYNDAGSPALQNYGRIVSTATDVSDGTEDSKMEFSTQANSVLTNTLTLNAGNVGIGTTAPAAFLHVTGATEQLRLGYDGSNYTSFIVDSSANLDIDSGGVIYLDAGNATGDTFFQKIGASYGRIGSQSGNDMIIACVTQDKDIIFKGNHNGVVIAPLVIDFGASGNVGIGTTVPTATLDVSGSVVKKVRTVTSADDTFTTTDYHVHMINARDPGVTITGTLPTAVTGKEIIVTSFILPATVSGDNQIDIESAGGDTINNLTEITINTAPFGGSADNNYDMFIFRAIDENTWAGAKMEAVT